MQLEAGKTATELLPCAGEGSNGGRIQMLPAGTEVEGANAHLCADGATAHLLRLAALFRRTRLKLAVASLEGKDVPKITILPLPLVTNETIKLCQEGTWEEMKAGCNAFKPSIVPNPGWFASIFSEQTPEIGLTPRWSASRRTKSHSFAGGCSRLLRRGFSARPQPAGQRMTEPAAMRRRNRTICAKPSAPRLRSTMSASPSCRAVVHALLGENGAGKSTIVKLLSGPDRSDARAAISSSATRCACRSPRVAHALGVQTAFQEMTLVRDLTVLDNMLLPYAPIGIDRHDPPPDGGARRCASISTVSGSTSTLMREVGEPRSRRAAEDRDRARDLPQAAHAAARRADIDSCRPRRRLARRADRPAQAARA